MNLAVALLALAVSLVSLALQVRHGLPRRRRLSERENAARGVAAAGQAGLTGEDAARYATQFVLDAMPKTKARHARMLVEHAVSEMKP